MNYEQYISALDNLIDAHKGGDILKIYNATCNNIETLKAMNVYFHEEKAIMKHIELSAEEQHLLTGRDDD